MEAVVKKWGNSLAIRIHSSYAKDVHIHDGSLVEIEKLNNYLKLVPHKQSLSEMLKKINKNNLHTEVETKGVLGNEHW